MLYIDFDLKRISVWHWKIHDLQLSNRAPGLYRENFLYCNKVFWCRISQSSLESQFFVLKKSSSNKIKSSYELSNDWVHLHGKPKYEEYLKMNVS